MHTSLVFVTALVSVAGCRSAGLEAGDPSSRGGNFRIAPITVEQVACGSLEAAVAQAYELGWARDPGTLTIDLYGERAIDGCPDLGGGAVIDTIANTIFFFFDVRDQAACRPSACAGPYGPYGHVRLQLKDDLDGLVDWPDLVVTRSSDRPSLNNISIRGASFPLRSDFVQFVPTVTDAWRDPSSLNVGYAEPACSAGVWPVVGYPDGGLVVVPYATRPGAGAPCNVITTAHDFRPEVTRGTQRVLSKERDGSFRLVDVATR